MADCHDGMMKDHPRSCVSHNLPDLLAFLRLIAVNTAVGTECLVLHERTFVRALHGIHTQFRAFRTELSFPAVMHVPAVQADHLTDDFFFLFSFLFGLFHILYLPAVLQK